MSFYSLYNRNQCPINPFPFGIQKEISTEIVTSSVSIQILINRVDLVKNQLFVLLEATMPAFRLCAIGREKVSVNVSLPESSLDAKINFFILNVSWGWGCKDEIVCLENEREYQAKLESSSLMS